MKENIKALDIARKLNEVLLCIEELTYEYDADKMIKIYGSNEKYIDYCNKKAKQCTQYEVVLDNIYNETYCLDISERKEPNIDLLKNIIIKQFKLLDDIDTAGDIFKPKWDYMSRTIEQLHRLRWLYCDTINISNNGESMTTNENCFSNKIQIEL